MRLQTRFGLHGGAALLLIAPALSAQAPSLPSLPAPAAYDASAGVAGAVVSADGALISGAFITLSAAGRPDLAKSTHSDQNGHFALTGVQPGAYTLTITLPGFTPGSRLISLAPSQALQVSPIALSLASVSITVDAITPEQLALRELHAEEHQRLLGALPNFFVSYDWTAPPLTTRQKFTLATHNAADPGNLALVGVTAGIQQAANAFSGYGQGAAGFGRRYGADLGNLVVGTYMGGAVLPSLFRQDPRFFYKGNGTKRSRFVYAVSRALITRGDNGHNQPNFAGVLGDLSAAALSEAYYPASDRQGPGLFLTNGLLAIGGDAMNGVVQEFFLHRVTTKSKPSD